MKNSSDVQVLQKNPPKNGSYQKGLQKMENTQVRVRKQTQPLTFPRTRRPDIRAMNTSARAGKVYPAAFIPLMPEDTMLSSRVSFMARMEETEKLLSNAVHFRAHAYFVSLAALERFNGLDSVAYAWAQKEGAAAVIEKAVKISDQSAFYHAFGEHIPDGAEVNTLYLEAYNAVINYRRKQVSISLPERTRLQSNLARALWGSTALARIVPDFDAALIEGEVELNVTSPNIPVDGINRVGLSGGSASTTSLSLFANPSDVAVTDSGGNYGMQFMDDISVDFQNAGVTMSVANLERAKKMQAFAVLRQGFAGNDDDLIDLAMRGLRFPNQAYVDPIHIGSGSATFGMAQRYATDSANLEEYVVNGSVRVDIPLRVPQQPTGGVVVITYEIIPEPVFDRQADMFLYANFDDLPNALRDHLDTQPVDAVPNRFVDSLHTAPDGHFGYAPLNYEWIRRRVGVGGRFLRTLASDPSAEDQQHIWSVRTVDPVLNEDTFLVPTDLAHNVFRDTLLDPFLVQCAHSCVIEGITQFGPTLFESQGDYEAVAEYAPTVTIDPTA